MEYEYVIVSSDNSGGYNIERLLREGYSIDRATPTDHTVHYVLSLKKAVPAASKPDEAVKVDQLSKADAAPL
jgi:hypothetical protein